LEISPAISLFYDRIIKNLIQTIFSWLVVMADPTTELAREFLEFHNYLVRKETKFYKSKEQKGTPSDIDIIAISPCETIIGELKLRQIIIAEVKNWQVVNKDTLDAIYEDKFQFLDDEPAASWKQLKKYIPQRRFDKVLFCLATTEDVYNYAWKKYRIKIVTTGFIIKQIAELFKERERRWSYYPERYNYNVIRSLMYYLYNCYKWKDKLTLQDLVWIDPVEEPRYRNQFMELNGKFFEEFVYHQTNRKVLINLINRLTKDDPRWFKNQLKSNKTFWKYLVR